MLPNDCELNNGLLMAICIVLLLILPHLLTFLQKITKETKDNEEPMNATLTRSEVLPSSPPADSSQSPSLGSSASVDRIVDENATSSNWRCACEGGFLLPGMLQSLGGAEAVVRMSTGQCYHKKN